MKPEFGSAPIRAIRGQMTSAKSAVDRGRFMESEVSFLERIAAMNLVALSSFAPPRSVTAEYSDAPPWEVARWKDWFRLATCALIGEPRGFPLGRFVLFGSQPGTVGRT